MAAAAEAEAAASPAGPPKSAPLPVGGRDPAKVKMEEILRKLQKEASGSKYKAIKESCTWALGKRGTRGAGHLPAGRAPATLLAAAGGPRGLGLSGP